MADAEKPEKRAAFSLKNMAAMATMGLLGFIGKHAWSALVEVQTSNVELRERIKELESDRAKWATLSDLHNKEIQLEADLQVTQRIFEYHFGKKIPPPWPHAESGAPPDPAPPKPVPPPPRPVDPDQFREMQQQKYPNEPRKK